MFFGRSIHIFEAVFGIIIQQSGGGTAALQSALGTGNLREPASTLRAGRLPGHETSACLEPDPEGPDGDQQGNEDALLEPPVDGEEPIVDAGHLETLHLGRSEVSRALLLHLHHRVKGHPAGDEIDRHDRQDRPGEGTATPEPSQAMASGMSGVFLSGMRHLVSRPPFRWRRDWSRSGKR